MTQVEKARKINMDQPNYSRTLTRLKTKSFLTDNDKKVLECERLEVVVRTKGDVRK